METTFRLYWHAWIFKKLYFTNRLHVLTCYILATIFGQDRHSAAEMCMCTLLLLTMCVGYFPRQPAVYTADDLFALGRHSRAEFTLPAAGTVQTIELNGIRKQRGHRAGVMI